MPPRSLGDGNFVHEDLVHELLSFVKLCGPGVLINFGPSWELADVAACVRASAVA